jgi:hypothetical protein
MENGVWVTPRLTRKLITSDGLKNIRSFNDVPGLMFGFHAGQCSRFSKNCKVTSRKSLQQRMSTDKHG